MTKGRHLFLHLESSTMMRVTVQSRRWHSMCSILIHHQINYIPTCTSSLL